MPFKSEETKEREDSEIWNIAKGYTHLKILSHLVALDKYEILANYGYEDINDMFILSPEMITHKRIEALNRLKDTIAILISNTNFSVEKEGRLSIKRYEERIKDIINPLRKEQDIINLNEKIRGISFVEDDFIHHKTITKINENHFKSCLNELQIIKKEINTPLKKLIFKASEEFSFEELKDNIIRGG